MRAWSQTALARRFQHDRFVTINEKKLTEVSLMLCDHGIFFTSIVGGLSTAIASMASSDILVPYKCLLISYFILVMIIWIARWLSTLEFASNEMSAKDPAVGAVSWMNGVAIINIVVLACYSLAALPRTNTPADTQHSQARSQRANVRQIVSPDTNPHMDSQPSASHHRH